MKARYAILFIVCLLILLAVFAWSFTWDEEPLEKTGTLVYGRMWNYYG